MLDLIFDGQCLFCRRALAVFKAMDILRRVRLHDATDRQRILREFPSLAGVDLDDAMFAVAPSGAVYRGFFAFRRLAFASPLTWPLLMLFYFPGASVVGPQLYAWVARNRRQFGCESEVCVIEPPKN